MTLRPFAFGAAALLSLATTGPALAGSLAAPAPDAAIAPAAVPVPVTYGSDWTGGYVGGSLGFGKAEGSGTLGTDVTGMTYGVQGGYLYDMGSIVLGGEAQYEMGQISDATSGTDIDSTARLKLRAGYDAGGFLPYLTAGWAQMTTSGGIAGTDTGLTYGAGVDYQLSDSIRLGAEILRDEYEDFAGSGEAINETTLGARVSFSF